jgi:hypothetical protein
MKEMIERLTSVQSNILIELARYKFLTASQLHKLNVGKDIGWIRTQAKELEHRSKPFIERITFGIVPREGKLEHVFFLTKQGKDILIEGMNMHPEEIKLPIGNASLFYKDYKHRRNTIDFQIALYKHIEEKEDFRVDFFDCYFDKVGNNRTSGNLEAKNKILIGEDDYIIPDAIFMLSNTERKFLFLFEMYDGKDTKRVFEQVRKHARATALGSPSEKYNHQNAHRIILLFEFERMKNAFLERTKNSKYFNDVAALFRCKSIEGMNEDFYRGWQTLKGESVGFI